MKVFNLKCEHGHPFEGWFKSHVAFEDQQSRGLLACPFCDSRVIEKTLSAPRLNLSGAQSDVSPDLVPKTSATTDGQSSPSARFAAHPQAAALAVALDLVRQMLAQSEDVGDRFPEEARAMHADEIPVRAIHGSASLDTAQELAEEGIPIVAIPFPGLLKTPLQ
ncbi:MAG: DUF1178 family protein [Burkholderiaceae bacterium]|nr:DUF1178 family protein [Burkholderiaceae bacterium]